MRGGGIDVHHARRVVIHLTVLARPGPSNGCHEFPTMERAGRVLVYRSDLDPVVPGPALVTRSTDISVLDPIEPNIAVGDPDGSHDTASGDECWRSGVRPTENVGDRSSRPTLLPQFGPAVLFSWSLLTQGEHPTGVISPDCSDEPAFLGPGPQPLLLLGPLFVGHVLHQHTFLWPSRLELIDIAALSRRSSLTRRWLRTISAVGISSTTPRISPR
jgi:hypothetical protein